MSSIYIAVAGVEFSVSINIFPGIGYVK